MAGTLPRTSFYPPTLLAVVLFGRVSTIIYYVAIIVYGIFIAARLLIKALFRHQKYELGKNYPF